MQLLEKSMFPCKKHENNQFFVDWQRLNRDLIERRLKEPSKTVVNDTFFLFLSKTELYLKNAIKVTVENFESGTRIFSPAGSIG